MRTSIGDFLMNLRMSQNQRLKDMAGILGVSSAFLSAVENGKKSMPDFWVKKIQAEYGLTEVQVDEMKNAALESQGTIALNMKNASSLNRELAVSFARQFDGMDEETSKMILQVLRKRKKKEDN